MASFSPSLPASSVLDLVGNTPLLRVSHLDTGPCELFLKLENQNPGGSIKDRVGVSMIQDAERTGRIGPGSVLVEATAGNTGLGLALAAQAKGYRLILVIPDKMSREKIAHLKALGAEIVLTRSDVGKGHPEYYQDLAESIARKTPQAYFVNQFGNPANPGAHEQTTGPEIFHQLDGRLDAIVCGVGSSGTITGLSRYFARALPDLRFVLADPSGSILADIVSGRQPAAPGSWMVEGIGEDFVPSIADLSRVAKAYSIPDAESFTAARQLLRHEGILGGSSTGTLLAAALRYCRESSVPLRVLTFVCDTGNKYLSRFFDDGWMAENGFTTSSSFGDLRDLIPRPYERGEVVVLSPDDSLAQAHARMKLYSISQLPVLRGVKLVGILDESDLLIAVTEDPTNFQRKVEEFMSPHPIAIEANEGLARLTDILRDGLTALIMHEGSFAGIITKIDLIQYLRRRGA